MFSKELLAQLSTPELFARGEKYYRDGRLRSMLKMGHVFQAEITGTRPYYTQISLEAGDIQGYCSCPYQGDHWCKHLVATGLGIMEDRFEEIPNQSIGLEPLSGFMSRHVKPAKQFHTFGFLEQLFAKNPHLQAEFLRYTRALPGPLIDIPAYAQQWAALIREEEEDFELLSERQCVLPLLEALEFGQYDTAGQYWLAAYEASFPQKEAAARDRAQDLLSLMATHLEDALREATFPPPLAKRLIEFIFARWELFDQQHGPSYQWSQLAWLMELLCADLVSAQFMQHKLTAYGLDDPFLLPVKERITEILG